MYLTNLPRSYPRWSKDFSFGRLAVECIFSYLKLLRKVPVFLGGWRTYFWDNGFWDQFFFGWTPILLQKDRDHPAAFSNRPSAEPEDAGTIIDESIPKATEWTLYILIQELLQLTIVIFLVIFGEQHSCIFLLIWLGDIESLWRILQNHLGLIKGPDIDKVQSKRCLNS